MFNSYKIIALPILKFSCTGLICLIGLLQAYGQIPERVHGSKAREADRLLELAKTNIDRQQFQQALAQLDRSLQYQTDHVEAYFTRALVKEQLNDVSGAFTDYQIVLLLDSTFREAAFNRAKLRYREKQFHRAIGDFNKLLTMGSSGTQVIYFKGTRMNKEGAVGIEQITTGYHLQADIYNYLGLCYQALNDDSSAIAAWEQAIDLNPDDANFYVNRGLSYASMGSSKQAVYDFESALLLAPNHPIALFNLTQQLEVTGNLDISTYDQLIEDNPEFTSAYVNRALAKLQAGDIDGALADYGLAINIDPNDADLYINRALAFEKVAEWRKSLADYNQALQIDPLNAKALRSRGRVLYQLDQYELSLEDFHQAIRVDPSHGGSYFNRALVYRKTGAFESACNDLKQALKLGVKSAGKAFQEYCTDLQ
ncbi:MAG: hypothetical protein DHS20C17_07390 [Cyclobacteriaceae bacterium]|nr:MAG: hypothetical protein DHS20C17_07390 [Cyclobacteriaceae bacterium]